MLRLVYSALAFAVLLFATGCSGLVYDRGVRVDQFRGAADPAAPKPRAPHGGTAEILRGVGEPPAAKFVSQAQVRKEFGQPIATKTFAPPLSVAQAKKRGLLGERDLRWGPGKVLPAFRSIGCIAQVDEHRLKGPTVTADEWLLPEITTELAKYSLGLSELFFFPASLWDYCDRLNDVTTVYFFYDRHGLLLGQTDPEKRERKAQPPSRLQ